MKKHQNLFILVFAFTLLITGCISCSKQNAPSNRVGNQHVSGITVASLQKKFKTEMSPSIYNDLDWQHGLVTSLDLDHPNSMIRVKSKTDPNKALYYSDIDGVQRAYVVTTTDKTIDVRTIKDTPLSRFTLSSSNVVKTETFSNGGENYVPKQPDPDCEKCTLPPAEVTVALLTAAALPIWP